jgi:hypothetical protein
MKHRESRRKVMITARIRVGAVWQDASILNISTRGLMVQALRPPQRGAYVEIGRGRHVIVARVAWVEQHRVGLRSQDQLPVDAIIAGVGDVAADAPAGDRPVELRSVARSTDVRQNVSRWRARAFEFACIGAMGVAGSVVAFDAVVTMFNGPLHAVTDALAAR